jgi:hypothetical protein
MNYSSFKNDFIDKFKDTNEEHIAKECLSILENSSNKSVSVQDVLKSFNNLSKKLNVETKTINALVAYFFNSKIQAAFKLYKN